MYARVCVCVCVCYVFCVSVREDVIPHRHRKIQCSREHIGIEATQQETTKCKTLSYNAPIDMCTCVWCMMCVSVCVCLYCSVCVCAVAVVSRQKKRSKLHRT